MPGAPKIVRTGDSRIDRSFQAISQAVRQLEQPAMDGAIMLTGIDVSTSTKQVSHTLGRQWIGWAVADRTGDVRVWRDATADKTPALTLPLVANASGTVSILVW